MEQNERKEKKPEEKRTQSLAARKKTWTVITAAVAVVASLAVLFFYQKNLREKEAAYDKLRETEMETEENTVVPETEVVLETETETETETEEICEQIYDFAELHQQNEDIYAWIRVPETQVDYPVLQSETDNYYLERNLDRSGGYPGCIYTNKCNTRDFTDYITVLYGHNMKNGTMFGSIHKFEDKEFFDANSEIVVYTEEKRLTYEVYASVKFSDIYIPAGYEVTTEEGRDSFLADVKKFAEGSSVSHIREGVEIAAGDKLIVLSTCVSGERPKRYLVVGKLVEEVLCDEKVRP